MKIGIIGFGVVGKGVYDQAMKSHEIVAVLDRKQKPQGVFFDNFNDFIKQDMEVMIEALPNIEEAYRVDEYALNKGISVISSNKAIVSKYYKQLLDTAKRNNCFISFEASVCGGIPILHNLCDLKIKDEILYTKGIMNGTSNYILDSIFSHHISFDEALNKAIELGYAEKDYSSDIDGDDVMYKTFLTSLVSYNTLFHLDSIVHYGIRYLNDEIVQYCYSQNKTLKLIGYTDKENAFVLPMLLNKNNILSNINRNNNCVLVSAFYSGPLSFIGQGAGSYPTASSIMLDLVRPLNDIDVKKECDSKNNKEFKYLVSKGNVKEEWIEERISKNLIITKPLPVSCLKDIYQEGCFIGGYDD